MPDFKAPAAALILAALSACALVESGAPGAAVASGDDACGAAGLQTLVGTSVGTLDPAALPDPKRVIFPGQAVTMDFQAERLNVEIGADDQVARVFCG